MTDYVSLRAVLDIVMQYCPDDDGGCTKADRDIRDMLDEIEGISATDVQPVDRWISVKDRLPNDRERVIVHTVEGSVLEMKFDKRRESWGRLDIDGMEWFGKSFVTHWQPLPEPPKEE